MQSHDPITTQELDLAMDSPPREPEPEQPQAVITAESPEPPQQAEPPRTISAMIESKRDSLEQISDRIGVDRLIKLAQIAVSRSTKLRDCTPASLLTSIADAARLGLDPSGTLNSAYLVPHYNGKTGQMECQLIPGYGGLIDLVCRSGKIYKVEARVVYEQDEFAVEYGTDPVIRHTPSLNSRAGGQITHAYAVFYFRGGGYQFEVMDASDINAIRDKALSKTNGYGPWKDHYPEMARKCPIRRAVKTLSIDIDDNLAHAVELSDRSETVARERARQSAEGQGERIAAALDTPQTTEEAAQ